jgi:hypothetical protein
VQGVQKVPEFEPEMTDCYSSSTWQSRNLYAPVLSLVLLLSLPPLLAWLSGTLSGVKTLALLLSIPPLSELCLCQFSCLTFFYPPTCPRQFSFLASLYSSPQWLSRSLSVPTFLSYFSLFLSSVAKENSVRDSSLALLLSIPLLPG